MSYRTKLKLLEVGTLFSVAMFTAGIVFAVCRVCP